MNPFDSPAESEAKLIYLDADFKIRRPGAYVTCAVTGKRIPLENLKYWSVDKQEAYIDAEAALQGFTGKSEEKV